MDYYIHFNFFLNLNMSLQMLKNTEVSLMDENILSGLQLKTNNVIVVTDN